MDWGKLLSIDKLVGEEAKSHHWEKYPINNFETDYHRIVSSGAFRRLQDKTQVFPLDKSDFVRTRLTHSIEVSTIARQLGIMITKNKTDFLPQEFKGYVAEDIPSVLLCAGLLHDLGNPPFGHFGEEIIGSWFKDNLTKIEYKGIPLKSVLDTQMIKDLESFEGNAQALRILAKARLNSEINLSFSVISTMLKYPTSSLYFDKNSDDCKKRKMGYFLAEQESFFEISRIVGTIDENGEVRRHPLSFVLEAADDIAYATADLEDALKKGLFSLDEFISFFESARKDDKFEYSKELIDNLKNRRANNGKSESDSRIFSEWMTYVRKWLKYAVAFRFSSNYSEIMDGSYKNDLFHGTFHEITIKILKNAMATFAFDSPSIVKLELSAQNILSFLLDNFVRAVLYYDCECDIYKPSKADRKLWRLLSNNHRKDYDAAKKPCEIWNLYLRLLMVTDFISGMTDSFARTLYRELYGIE